MAQLQRTGAICSVCRGVSGASALTLVKKLLLGGGGFFSSFLTLSDSSFNPGLNTCLFS